MSDRPADDSVRLHSSGRLRDRRQTAPLVCSLFCPQRRPPTGRRLVLQHNSKVRTTIRRPIFMETRSGVVVVLCLCERAGEPASWFCSAPTGAVGVIAWARSRAEPLAKLGQLVESAERTGRLLISRPASWSAISRLHEGARRASGPPTHELGRRPRGPASGRRPLGQPSDWSTSGTSGRALSD